EWQKGRSNLRPPSCGGASRSDASRTMGHEYKRRHIGRHASRAFPTCASMVPNSGKPEFGVLRDALASRGLLRMRADRFHHSWNHIFSTRPYASSTASFIISESV